MVELTLPPAELPILPAPTPGPAVLRPLETADGAACFAVMQESLTGGASPEQRREWQARWAGGERAWSGWLGALPGIRGVAATLGDGGPLIGYARAARDPVRRVEQLTELFVRPAYQGGGLGRSLLSAVLTPAVAPGWRRVIVANPVAPALALYLAWGVFPLATAWYLTVAAPADASAWHPPDPAGCLVTVPGGMTPTPSAGLGWDDRPAGPLDAALPLPHREALRAFLATLPAAVEHRTTLDGVPLAYGWRVGERIGPVLGATPAAAQSLTATLLRATFAAGTRAAGLWAPGPNVALLGWLRPSGLRVAVAGQATLLADTPATLAALERMVLPGWPYVL